MVLKPITKKAISWISVACIIPGLIFAIILSGTGYILEMDATKAYLLNHINKAFPATIDYDSSSVSLIKGRLQVKGLRIHDVHHEPILELEQFKLNLNLPALLKKEVMIEDVLIDSLTLWISLDEKGNLNLLDAFKAEVSEGADESIQKKPQQDLPFNIRIIRFMLKNSHVTFIKFNPDGNDTIRAENLMVRMENGNLERRSGLLETTVQTLHLKTNAYQDTIQDAQLKTTLSGDDIDTFSVSCSSDPVSLSLTGKILSFLTEPDINTHLKAEINLDKLGDPSRLNLPLQGSLDLDFRLMETRKNPEAELTLIYGGGEIYGIPMDKTVLQTHLKDNIVTFQKLATTLYQQSIQAKGTLDLSEAFPNGLDESPVLPDLMRYHLELDHQSEDIIDIPENKHGLSGHISSTLTINGQGITPELAHINADLIMQSKDIRFPQDKDPIEMRLNISSELKDGLGHIKHIILDSSLLHAEATLIHRLLSDSVNADLVIESQNLEPLLSRLGIENTYGSLRIETTISESLKNPHVTLSLMGNQLKYNDNVIEHLNFSGSLAPNGTVTVSNLHVENTGSLIAGKGDFDLFGENLVLRKTPEMDFNIDIDNVNPRDFNKLIPLKGLFKGTIHMTGDMYNPEVKTVINGTSLSIRQFKLGDIQADADYHNGVVDIHQLSLANNQSNLNITGSTKLLNPDSLELLEDPEVIIHLLSKGLSLEDFNTDIKGEISLAGSMTGSVKNPSGHIILEGNQFDFGGQTVNHIFIESDFTDHEIHLKEAIIDLAPEQQIRAEGHLSPFSKTYDFKLISDDIQMKNVHYLNQLNFSRGKIHINLNGEGSFEKPEFQGTLGIHDLTIQSAEMEDTEFRFVLENNQAHLTGDNWFDIDAHYDLNEATYQAGVEFNNTDLTPWFILTGRQDLSGDLTGKLHVAGKGNDLKKLQVSSSFSFIDVRINDQELVRSENLNLHYLNQQLKIPGFDVSILEKGHLKLQGILDQNEQIHLTIDGLIPLEAVNAFTEIHDMRGDINITADISGSVRDPNVTGEIEFNKLGLTLPVLEQDLRELNGRIMVSPSGINLEKIKGFIDKGSFDVDGLINLDRYRPSDFSLSAGASNLTVEVPDQLTMTINSQVKMKGNRDESSATGSVTLLDGLYYKDIELNLLESVSEKKIEPLPRKKENTHSFLDNMKLDISVNRRKPFLIDNNMALMDLSPNLHIRGTPNQPVISGQARVDEGVILFRDNEFDIKKGIIDFLNPYQIEPTVDISSETKIREWVITMEISGTPDDLTFILSSQPQEDHEDILSLLFFGKTASELSKGNNGGSFSGTKLMANLASELFKDNIQEATGLDTLEFEYNDDEDAEGVNVTLGKDLSRRMAVKYSVETKKSQLTQRVTTEYKFLENLLFNAFQDTKGDYGGELQFKLEFR